MDPSDGTSVRTSGQRPPFLPAPLPPVPQLEFSPDLAGELGRAERALGRLEGVTHDLPNPELFVFMYVRKEAVLSSQIEGTQSSLADLLAAEAAIRRPDAPSDVDEVSGYVEALNYGVRELGHGTVSSSLTLALHKRLLRHRPDAGQLRDVQNWVGRPGSTMENAVYIPPPPDQIGSCLDSLFDFLDRRSDLPDLVRVCLAHAQFESIHPFVDGNGRVGRLLVTLLLKQYGVLSFPVLYLSGFLRDNRSEYYARLQATRDEAAWDAWCRFLLRGMRTVASDAALTAQRVTEMREEHREQVRARTGKGVSSALVLLDTLYYRPYVSVRAVSEIVGQTFAGASRLVDRFVEIGLLEPDSDKARNRVFAYRPYLELFSSS